MGAGGGCLDCGRKCSGVRCKKHDLEHRKKSKRPRPTCKQDGCDKTLSMGNSTGFCLQHRYRNQDRQDVDEGITTELGNTSGTVRSISTRIRTAEQAMDEAGVDRAEWYAEKQIVKKWEVLRRDDPEPVQLFGVTVSLRRKVPKVEIDAVEILCTRIAEKSRVVPLRSYKVTGERMMLEFSPFDAHFGKLAWSRETGEDYDLEIAEELLANALEDTLRSVEPLKGIERIVFPIGSDFLHTDTIDNTTTMGTPQDVDGRWAKVWATAQIACVRAIDRMTRVAPVTVLWVPGNHDWKSSFHLADYLAAWYRSNENVTFDLGPSPRKYIKYGVSLIGFTHGNEEKHSSLPGIMATERSADWAATAHHEWHTGHLHKRKSVQHTAVDTHDGVVVRILPSLSGRDAWHNKKGYLGGQRAAESYLWSYEGGYKAHYSANVRKA